MDVAPGGGATAAGPCAVLVPQGDGAADVGGDVLGVADVQRQAGGVVRGLQQAGAQLGGQAVGAGQEVDGQPGDGVAQRGPGLRGQRPGLGAGGVVAAVVGG